MKLKPFLRPSLTIIFGFIGVFVARSGTPPDIFAITGRYFLVVAALSFGTFGFLLPDLAEVAARSAVVALARQIAKHLPTPQAPRLSVPKFSFKRKRKTVKYINPIVVDTSALVDGRIVDVVQTGFLFGTLVVIPSVISELHTLSDSSDDLKRARGRRGLDVLGMLKKQKGVKLEVLGSESTDKTVDDKVVAMAKKIHGRVLTLDFNLNKVANVRGVATLNLNELASAVKTVVLPHEILLVEIRGLGKSRDQGVAYLDDGTMVVVEGGANLVGKSAKVEVLRVLETAAGRMIFGRAI